MAEKPHAPEMGGKGGFSGEESDIFVCPACNMEKAFPGQKPGEPPQCPMCAVSMKMKYMTEE
jgi:hypothetical protein